MDGNKRPFRLICDDTHPKWLEHRLSYTTGSEMALTLGKAPSWWSDTYESLLAAKRGGTPVDITEGMKEDRVRAMAWGSAAEEGNIDIFCRAMRVRARKMNVFLASEKHPRIATTLDGLVLAPDWVTFQESGLWSDRTAERVFCADLAGVSGLGVLEAKQSAGWKGQVAKWTEAPPDYYFYQVQTQLYVTGLKWGILFARLGVSDMRAHVIHADPFVHEEMEEAVEKFWAAVEKG